MGGKHTMKRILAIALVLLGVSGQLSAQTPAQGVEGSWQGTLDAGGTKLRLVLKVTKSDAGAYSAALVSVDQGSATIPVDPITVTTDSVRLEMKPIQAGFAGALNRERTELTGTFSQGGQDLPLTFKKGEQAAATEPAAPATPKPKPDYSVPLGAPYIAEEVTVKTPVGHTLAGTLTLPNSASREKPVAAIVTITRPVTTAPIALSHQRHHQPSSFSRSQRRTMLACESVNDRKTPTA